MSDLKELFEKGRWYHCFRHEGLTSNGVYDIEQVIGHYKFDDNYDGKTVLDVGCSDGYFSLWMKEHGARQVLAIDFNKYDGSIAMETADYDKHLYEKKYALYANDYDKFRRVYDQFGLSNSNKLLLMAALKKLEINFQTGTVYDLKPYGVFDLVLCNDLIEHIRDPITAIEQLYRAVAENGKCVITTLRPSARERLFAGRSPILSYQGHISSGGYFKFSEASVVAMCKAAGFKRVEIVSRFGMLNRTHNVISPLFVAHAYK